MTGKGGKKVLSSVAAVVAESTVAFASCAAIKPGEVRLPPPSSVSASSRLPTLHRPRVWTGAGRHLPRGVRSHPPPLQFPLFCFRPPPVPPTSDGARRDVTPMAKKKRGRPTKAEAEAGERGREVVAGVCVRARGALVLDISRSSSDGANDKSPQVHGAFRKKKGKGGKGKKRVRFESSISNPPPTSSVFPAQTDPSPAVASLTRFHPVRESGWMNACSQGMFGGPFPSQCDEDDGDGISGLSEHHGGLRWIKKEVGEEERDGASSGGGDADLNGDGDDGKGGEEGFVKCGSCGGRKHGGFCFMCDKAGGRCDHLLPRPYLHQAVSRRVWTLHRPRVWTGAGRHLPRGVRSHPPPLQFSLFCFRPPSRSYIRWS
uniref:Uncharacterized protein n=1 Tax=Chromera velia CCMP2878 TaxID=1169474 RepID=A0A0G4I259_9ALVE|eukprot:Cvel_1693.t1-p1 / transcript=Cvel_1693.t1 / gene=Cvel_1693 / organism=Chromera_velia_CCMP2878 / gene_product=hypothetical protein / transcript_product=hypothetical protein / location=Cvel_scaffold61:5179-9266(-) / protein_length=373 / sequence_SO=supercontig / SO=protein_coding / is_pseudo=false